VQRDYSVYMSKQTRIGKISFHCYNLFTIW